MKNASSFTHGISFRSRGLALASLLFFYGFASPLASFAAASDTEALPAAPSATLQLGGTLASVKVAPSKLDNGPMQTPAPPPPALQIAILEGEDVSNNIKERTAREPIVQVTDENHKPVAGAVVLFTVTTQSGHAGASFLNGAKTYQGTTDAEGKVTARGFHPNGHTGQFHVNVTASKVNLSARSTIAQMNVAAASASATSGTIPGFIATHVVLVSAVVSGAVVGGVVAGAVVNVNNSTTIAAGTGTVGAPTISRGPNHESR